MERGWEVEGGNWERGREGEGRNGKGKGGGGEKWERGGRGREGGEEGSLHQITQALHDPTCTYIKGQHNRFGSTIPNRVCSSHTLRIASPYVHPVTHNYRPTA